MTGLISIKNKIRDFCRKYDLILEPIFYFILAYIMFNSINTMYGYSDLFDKKIVIVLLSVISALVSSPVVVLLGFFVILVNSFAISLELGISMLVVCILVYCLYMRMFPDTAFVLALVPILCMWKMTFIIPIIVMILVGAAGIVPTAFGLALYNISLYIREIHTEHMTEDENFQAYTYLVEQLSKNKDMILMAIVFAAVIMVSYIIYRLPFKFSWYIGIAVATVMNILCFGFSIPSGSTISMGAVAGGSMLGLVIGLLIQLCKNVMDYSKVEDVQFEDDEYYYYVKAIPKIGGKQTTNNETKTGNHDKNVQTKKRERNENASRTAEQSMKNAQVRTKRTIEE